MNIWIYNHYADPPHLYATRSYDLALELVKRGHQVTIVASSFSHYKLIETQRYGWRFFKHEAHNGVRFLWIRTPSYRANDWRRVLNIVTYSLWAFCVGLGSRPDAVFGVTVHPLAALVAYFVAALKRAPYYYEITDLWPETLIQFGQLHANGMPARLLYALERFLFTKARRVIVFQKELYRYASRYNVPEGKIVWIPHVVNLERFQSIPSYSGDVGEYFTIVYMGGLVWSNDLDTVLEAARLLQHVPTVRFLIYGDGTDKSRLIEKAKSFALTNLEFCGTVPKNEISRIVARADAFVFPYRNFPLYQYGYSTNKLTDYLASGRPILSVGPYPNIHPVTIAEAGLMTPPGDAVALANSTCTLINLSPDQRRRMGENGLEYVKEYHEVTRLASKLEAMLHEKDT